MNSFEQPDPSGLDSIPADARALDTTPIDYIVVGSGPGGGPLAARLARAGMRVLVLERGVDAGAAQPTLEAENARPLYHCPGLHMASVEPQEHPAGRAELAAGSNELAAGSAGPHPQTALDVPVRHYHDEALQAADSKARDFAAFPGQRRQLYPRAAALGGCSAHHAMIAVVPPDDDWRYIEELTADPSWAPPRMREIYRRLERSTSGRYRTAIGQLWDWLLDLWNPGRDEEALRGRSGWLDVSLTDPKLALHDTALLKVIQRVAIGQEACTLHAAWRWIKSILMGRFYRDLDLNDARTMTESPEGVALLPLSVSARRVAGRSLRSGMRRGPREFLLETRDALNAAASAPGKDGAERGKLLIATGIIVRRAVFQREEQGNAPRAVGVEVQRAGDLPQDDHAYPVCYASREVIFCGGAFASPQLLMLSGIGDSQHLHALGVPGPRDATGQEVQPPIDLPGVGKNLRDRYEISVVSRMREDWKSLEGVTFDPDSPDDRALKQWKRPTRNRREGVYTTNGGAVAVLKKSSTKQASDKCRQETQAAQSELPSSAPPLPDLFLFGFPAAFRGYYPGWSKDLLNDRPNAKAPGQGNCRNLWTWTILKAWSGNTGEVRLHSPDPSQPCDVNFRYFEKWNAEEQRWKVDRNDPDLEALAEGVAFARQINDRAGDLHADGNAATAEIQPGRALANNSAKLRDWIVAETWGHHACGTCRIGADAWQANAAALTDPLAVVDSRFRVHGVRGLRVVDASVFPRIPGYFLVVPVYMIAEKAAETILADVAAYPRQLQAREAAAIRQRRARARLSGDVRKPNPAATPGNANGGPPPGGQVPLPTPGLPAQTVGLALSGGGIRSATFALGVLQALAEKDRLRQVDLLSTVSGGGYIGAFLGSLFVRPSALNHPDPCQVVQQVVGNQGSEQVRWLRRNANYLVSVGATDWWQHAAVYWRNVGTLYFVLLSLAVAVFSLLRLAGDEFLPWLLGKLLGVTVSLRDLAAAVGLSPTADATAWSFISPWWWLPVSLLLLGIVPAGIAYWLAQKPGSRGFFSFFPLVAWLLGTCGFALATVLPQGFWFGVAGLAMSLSAVLWLEVVRLSPRDGSPQEALRHSSVLLRNRLTRGAGRAVRLFTLASAWVLIDTFARFVAQGGWNAYGLAMWAGMAAPLVPFVRSLASKAALGDQPADKAANGSAGQQRKSPRVGLLLIALFLLGFLLSAVDAGVHFLFRVDRDWALGVMGLGLALSVALARAFDFLNFSSLRSVYAARLTRTFLGASNPARLNPIGLTPWSNEQVFHPKDDIAWERYHPEDSGGPLHLVGVCINETVDVASQREIPDRRALPMCVGPCGVSVGIRFHSLWVQPDPTLLPWYIKLRRFLDGLGNDERRTALQALVLGTDPFHPLASKQGGPAFVESLRLGDWIAVSGAAFGTGTGRGTTKAAALLAGLANARLGYWWDSGLQQTDRRGLYPGRDRLLRRLLYLPRQFVLMQSMLLSEWMGRFGGPSLRLWNLSDGGHFDNLGIYELVRRRVPFMIAVDATADPGLRFDELAGTIRQVRIDFGAEVEFLSAATLAAIAPPFPPWIAGWLKPRALADLRQIGQPGGVHAALAQITWVDDPGARSWLLYLKASLTGDETADIANYKTTSSEFPSERTTDQFFDESQWESYRKLGHHIGRQVF